MGSWLSSLDLVYNGQPYHVSRQFLWIVEKDIEYTTHG